METNKLLLSVIMSTYNEKDEYLDESINSIINQSFKDWELIIIVDAPNNKHLIEKINEYASYDKRISVYVNPSNMGLALSLNEALKHCSGKYIARMDADDICFPDRFKRQVTFLEENANYSLVYTNRKDINEEGKEIGTDLLQPKDDKCLMKSLSYGSLITHPSVMIRKSALDLAGGYNNFPSGQDYDLWLRLRRNGCYFHYMKEPLLKYRIRSNSISKSKMGLQILCGQYARNIDKQGTPFREKDFKEYVDKKYENCFFNLFVSLRERISKKEKVNYWVFILLFFFSPDFRRWISNSIMVRKYAK